MTAAPVTLVDLLRRRASEAPDGLAYTFLREGIHADAAFTYAGLDRMARATAVALARMEPAPPPGMRVLLLYPPGIDFLAGFFGCLYAGLVPIPAPPPDAARLKRTLPRLLSILRDAGTRYVLSTAAIRQHARMAEAEEGAGDILWLAHEDVEPARVGDWEEPVLAPDDLAYLQYTSGSTSTPKGVMLTHANVLHHLESLRLAWDYRPGSVGITWMPYFHDYGLVDGLLEPLYAGIPSYVLSPLTFVKRPQRWLEAIHRFRGTHTQAPNFAYELCLEKITPDQRDALDLRSWRVASNGAEPVRADTLRRFAQYFAPCGFRAEALYPSYGMAEATLLVSTKPHGEAARISRTLEGGITREVVSCGPPLPSTEVVIAAQDSGRQLPDGETGEIWIRDEAVAVGYWNRPEDSAATFGARLSDAPGRGPYLRTGDLGFLSGGELHVTGRTKDLIIIAGVNHYPQDVEWTAQQAAPELRTDHCAAFAVEAGGEERLVLVAEANRPLENWEPVFSRIRQAVAESHEAEVHAIGILRRGGILKTSSGKLQRQACRAAWAAGELDLIATWQRPERAPTAALPKTPVRASHGSGWIAAWLETALSRHLGVPVTAIDPMAAFASLGLTSRLGVQLVGELEDWLGREELSPTLLWEHPTVAALSAHLAGEAVPLPQAPRRAASGEPIAVVGMACRFPGAADPEAFWTLLETKGQGLRQLPEGRWDGTGVNVRVGSEPGCVATLQGGFLEDVAGFDASFFGIGGREARIMDPQQRLLLEVSWEALENAALAADRLAGSDTGVFVGISTDDYSVLQFADPQAISAYTGPAKALSIAANRISYHFDFHGPSLAIDTACSSSLVALHQAAQALRRGECSTALAGGVNLILSPQMSIALSQAGMLAPDGRCKTFDAEANGYVRGEGAAMLVLKRLSDAERDGDRVLAIVRGSAVNQDGRSNGLTAPNGLAQQEVVAAALADAGVSGRDIRYVETHGTGTSLGDPIEVKALQAVLGPGRSQDEPCAFGAVKANIGHLEAAAGVAGLLKTVLALQHGVIPPHPTLRSLNPLIRLEGTPFHVPTAPTPWPEGRRLAGVSSFGFGGTNAHVVLEAARAPGRAEASPRPRQFLALSARDAAALDALAGRWAARLSSLGPGESVDDLCFTANAGRAQLPYRLAASGSGAGELSAALGARNRRTEPVRKPRVAFLFTGQGAQHAGMAAGLFRTEPSFRHDLEQCDALLRPHLGHSLLDLLYAAESEAADERLARTEFTQPAMFAVSWALARLWVRWGITPAALAGHSIGEYAAACFAGVFSLEDALRIVTARGRLMQHCPGDGGMLAVTAALEEIAQAIAGHDVTIAAYNAPRNHVLAGGRAELEALGRNFQSRGIDARMLKVGHAFHSPLMAPALAGFARVFEGVPLQAPSIPVYSNVTGEPAAGEMAHASYWLDHLRKPVRFADAAAAMRAGGIDAFVEVGPRPALLALLRQQAEDESLLFLPSLRPGTDDTAQMLDSLGRLFERGADFDARTFHAEEGCRKVAAPTYPFQRERHWLPPVKRAAADEVTELPGRMVRSPLLPQTLFELRYGLAAFALWGEHRVFGQIVVPGAGHLSLLIEAAARLSGGRAGAVSDVIFPKALSLPETGARTVQLAVSEDGAFRLISLPEEDEAAWVEHASGRLSPAQSAGLPAVMPLDSVRQTVSSPLAIPFYEGSWQQAIALGPCFRWVAEVWSNAAGDQVLARLARPADATGETYRFHPGLLDSMLQILTALVRADEGSALVPFRIDSMRWTGAAETSELWSHLSIRSRSGEEIVSDVTLYRGDGTAALTVEGFRARRIAVANLMPAPAAAAEALLGDTDVYRQLWEEVASSRELPTGAVVCRLDGIGGKGLAADAATVLQHALGGLRTAVDGQKPLLILVTRGAVAAAPGDVPSPAQAAAWGLARVIRLEYPQIDCRCIDLAPNEELAWSRAEADVAIRGGKVLAPRLERESAPRGTPALRGDAAYLITGGLGGLGLALADWLAEQGVRHLILAGRTPPDEAKSGRLSALAVRGVTITLAIGDVARIAEDRPWEGGPPLAGIFHLAGVLDDRMLAQQDTADRGSLLKVLAPKLDGGAALDRATAHLNLDVFVCFSSVAGVTGSIGQGVYAAANAALDALVEARQARGKTALSLQWGPWAEAGMAAAQSERNRQRFTDYGISTIDLAPGLELTGRLLSQRGVRMVLPVRWPRYVARLHGGVVPALYRRLLQDQAQQAAAALPAAALAVRIAAAPAEERMALLDRELGAIVAAMLGRGDMRRIGPRQRFFELGLDSLGAVELRNRLAAALGKPLRTTLLFDFPTLEALTAHVAQDVLGWTAEPEPKADAPLDIDGLGEDELARLLAAELGGPEA